MARRVSTPAGGEATSAPAPIPFAPRLVERIRAAAEARRDAIVALTEALVRVPSENPPGRAYPECVAILARALERIGVVPHAVEVPAGGAARSVDGRPGGGDAEAGDGGELPRSCVLGWHGRGARTLWLHGHYDVVPANDPDQFRPHVAKGNLFGRGASDMKGGLAAMIAAVSILRDEGIDLDGRIGIALVPDEETGGARGSRWLAGAGLLGEGGVGMLTPEPTGGVVWNASRGAISLRVTVRGRPVHVGLSYQGTNAFEQALPVVAELEALKAEVASRATGWNLDPEAARRSILLVGGRAEGGSNFNVVPGSFSFTVDRRINPEEDFDEERARLLAIFDRARRAGIHLDVETLQEGTAAGCPPANPMGRALTSSIEAITGRRPAVEMCPGLLEIRFYADRGIPAFAYGPGLLAVSHGPHEFVKVKDLTASAAIYALTAARVLAPPV